MATEEKTYLVNVESNLDKYTKEAVAAGKAVDDLTEENKALKKSTEGTTEETEKNSAKLRAAKKDYTSAKKLVDLQTQANNSNANSRKQLNAIVTLEQRRLGSLANTYTINSEGVRELSKDYVEQVKRLSDAKGAVIEYDKAQKDGRSSVGLYSEAIEGSSMSMEGLPGPAGQAVGSIKALGASMKALLLNPVGLFIAAIAGSLALLYKAFTRSQSGATRVSQVMGGLKGMFEGLLKAIEPVANFIAGYLTKAFEVYGKIAEKLLNVFVKVTAFAAKAAKFLGFKDTALTLDFLSKSVKGWTDNIKEASQAGSDLAAMEVKLKNALRDVQTERLKDLNTAEKLRQLRDDEEASIESRIKANKELGEVLIKSGEDQLKVAKLQLEFANKKIDLEGESDENLDLRAEALQRTAEIEEEISGYRSEQLTQAVSLRREAADRLQAKKDEAAKELQAKKDVLNKEIEDYKKIRETDKKNREKAEAAEKKRVIELEEWKKERQLINQENILDIREQNNADLFNIDRARLEAEHQAALDNAEKTGADVGIINRKYANAQRQLDEEENEAKLGLYAGFAANLATIFGENTAIGRAAAIASTTIDTYAAAMAAYKSLAGVPVIGPALGIAAAAAAVAAGIANVKRITAVKSGLPGDTGGGSAPTSIAATPAAQRVFSSQAATSLVTQPQLSQTELNAASQGDILSAVDIAEAIRNIPAPIVTVEAFNVVAESKRKVEVRAVI